MVVSRPSLRAAIDEVASRDPVLAELVERVGYVKHCARDPDGPFAALVRAIVFQHLAGRAAQAIYGRVRTAVGDSLTPESLSAGSDPALCSAGLSGKQARLAARPLREGARRHGRPQPPATAGPPSRLSDRAALTQRFGRRAQIDRRSYLLR